MKTTQCGALLFAAVLTAAAGCEWLDKYNVRFGLRADMSDEAKDPNSVDMLGRPGQPKRTIERPVQEILTTAGLDEALDDDMNDISPAAEAKIMEKPATSGDLLVPTGTK